MSHGWLVTLASSSTVRVAIILLSIVLAMQVEANDLLWEKLRTEANLVVSPSSVIGRTSTSSAWN